MVMSTTTLASGEGTAATSAVSGSATPVAGRICYAMVGADDTTGAFTFSISNTHAGSWSWTELATYLHDAGSGTRIRVSIFASVVPSTPGAGTWTVTKTGGTGEIAISVAEYAEAIMEPVQAAGNTGTATTLAITMPFVGRANNAFLGAIYSVGNVTTTQGATYSEHHDIAITSNSLETARDITSPVDPSWSSLTNGNRSVAVCLEIESSLYKATLPPVFDMRPVMAR